jgi:hypothetical protein
VSKDYDNKGKVSLWKVENGGDKAPVLRGAVFAHRDIKAGEEVSVALWKNDRGGDRAPVLTGKLSDKYQGKPTKVAGDSDLDDADRLPF